MQRKNLSLDDDAARILDGAGNASRYVSRLVTYRRETWTAALATLYEDGWSRADVLAACRGLDGNGLRGWAYRQPTRIAEDLARLNIHPDLILRLAASRVLASALCEVSVEYSVGNDELAGRIAA